MPTICSKDKKGCFCRWGTHGKKYYYKCGNKTAKKQARAKADKQGRKIFSTGWRS